MLLRYSGFLSWALVWSWVQVALVIFLRAALASVSIEDADDVSGADAQVLLATVLQ
jgi:hypothetical protein